MTTSLRQSLLSIRAHAQYLLRYWTFLKCRLLENGSADTGIKLSNVKKRKQKLKFEENSPFLSFYQLHYAICTCKVQINKLYCIYEDTKGSRMVQKKTIGLTLRLDAKYKDVVDYLKMSRGALTRVVEGALDSVTVDQELLRRKREFEALAVEKIKETCVSQAKQRNFVKEANIAELTAQALVSQAELMEELETIGTTC